MKTLRQEFRYAFGPSAFGEIAGGEAIVAKWGNIVRMEDGAYDFWLIRPDGRPLTGKRFVKLVRAIKEIAPITELDGEAYGQVRDHETAVAIGRIIGARRANRSNPDAVRAGQEGLRRWRAAQG